MTCYMHNLKDLFGMLGLEYDKPNRDRLDAAIREALDVPESAHCPEVWAAVKSMPRAELADRVSGLLA